MKDMFCFQCQQTAHNTGCDGKVGVCGKKADTAVYQDELIGALIALANAAENGSSTEKTDNAHTQRAFYDYHERELQ